MIPRHSSASAAKPSPGLLYRATIRRTGEVLCEEVWMPSGFFGRMRGLLGRSDLQPSEGLLLQPSSGVHTFGMRFSIDVLALGREHEVLAMHHGVPPSKICGVTWRTRSVLEVAPGRLRQARVCRGDQIIFAPRSPDAAADAG